MLNRVIGGGAPRLSVRLKPVPGAADYWNVRFPLIVTGASGFVGARVVRLALERGHPVTAVVGPSSAVDRLLPVRGEIELVRADITDRAALRDLAAATRPAACVHLAAAGAVVREDDLDMLMATNAVAPAMLAQALAQAGCKRLVTAGSSSEYGPVAAAMDESMACDPDDYYGAAKLAGGLLARITAARYGLETVHARLFSVYGPGEDRRRLVASVIEGLLARRPIALTPGDQVRDFVYADDVAEALLDATERPGLDGVTLNLGTGVQTSVRQLCHALAELIGGHDLLGFGELPYRDGERFHWRAATGRTQQLLGWRARTPLAHGLERTIAAARQATDTRLAA